MDDRHDGLETGEALRSLVDESHPLGQEDEPLVRAQRVPFLLDLQKCEPDIAVRIRPLQPRESSVGTSVVSTQMFDVADTLFAEGCGKEVATRVY